MELAIKLSEWYNGGVPSETAQHMGRIFTIRILTAAFMVLMGAHVLFGQAARDMSQCPCCCQDKSDSKTPATPPADDGCGCVLSAPEPTPIFTEALKASSDRPDFSLTIRTLNVTGLDLRSMLLAPATFTLSYSPPPPYSTPETLSIFRI
jgi:hypothetical protein